MGQPGSAGDTGHSPNRDPETGELAPSASEGDPTLRYGNDEPISDHASEIQSYQAYLKAEK